MRMEVTLIAELSTTRYTTEWLKNRTLWLRRECKAFGRTSNWSSLNWFNAMLSSAVPYKMIPTSEHFSADWAWVLSTYSETIKALTILKSNSIQSKYIQNKILLMKQSFKLFSKQARRHTSEKWDTNLYFVIKNLMHQEEMMVKCFHFPYPLYSHLLWLDWKMLAAALLPLLNYFQRCSRGYKLQRRRVPHEGEIVSNVELGDPFGWMTFGRPKMRRKLQRTSLLKKTWQRRSIFKKYYLALRSLVLGWTRAFPHFTHSFIHLNSQ